MTAQPQTARKNHNANQKLSRTTLKTSRLLDYCSEKALTLETGHGPGEWPLVILKELLDNALDAAEDAGVAPEIAVTVDEKGIAVEDNGPGIPPETVEGILDFTARTSSREHYVSPTRGAQGNALKTVLAMPYVLDGLGGHVEIDAEGVRHEIGLAVDRIRQEPAIDHQRQPGGRKNGTRVAVHWPDSSTKILTDAEARFLQMADDYTFLNPHLGLTVDWFGSQSRVVADEPAWRKWMPGNPTSAHWYTLERFERLVCGYLSHDADNGRGRLVREFVAEFDGLTGSAKQKQVLDATGLSRQPLSALRNGRELNHDCAGKLLAAMRAASRPVKPQRLGAIGKDHLAVRFAALGCEMESFRYNRQQGETAEGAPCVMETAFAWRPEAVSRRLITGVNWSPGIRNPFRQLGKLADSLDSLLAERKVRPDDPVVLLLHVACPRVSYADRGKSQIVL